MESHLTLKKGMVSIFNGIFRTQLEMALFKLQSNINAEELLFWGKINGIFEIS
jgi:hypothetical protein